MFTDYEKQVEINGVLQALKKSRIDYRYANLPTTEGSSK